MLVHDAFMCLAQNADKEWANREHFFAVAAKAMRDLLVDHARRHRAQKRGGIWKRIALSGLGDAEAQEQPIDVLDLEDALRRLGEADARQELPSGLLADDDVARGVEFHFESGDNQEPPELISRYRVKRMLGEGGMGIVWLAEQESPRRDVAVKVIRGGLMSREMQRRFEHEASLLARLRHPGIAQVFEAGMHGHNGDSRPFFAMEFVDGLPLMEYAQRKDLDVRARLELFASLCRAVQHAHQRGVIHRDLKPANILVTSTGQPKILDFGVARAIDSGVQASTLHISSSALIGTLSYMSPEQVSGRADDVDARSDVYALGALMYELLAGKMPYALDEKSLANAARIIADQEPAPLTTVSRLYRGDLNTIALKALEKDADRRYQSASDLAADVDRCLRDEPIIARPATTMYQLRKFVRRNRGLAAGVMLAFVVLVGGSVVAAMQAARVSDERDAAQAEADFSSEVAKFLYEVLTAADPNSRGAEATVREAIDRAAAKIDAKPPDNPRVEFCVRTTIGSAYVGIGLYPYAEPHLLRALECARAWSGPDGHDTAIAAAELGRLRVHQARSAEAESLFHQAVAIYERNPPEDPAGIAVVLHSLATACEQQARFDEAESFARRAHDIYQTVDGYEQNKVLVLQTLAGVLYSLDRPEECEQVIEDANRRARESLGDSPGILANGLNLLALAYFKSDRREVALELQREVAAIHSTVLAEDNPNLGISVLNLGMTLRGLERFDEAEIEIRRAAEIFERGLGSEHAYAMHARAALAELLVTTDRLEGVEPLLTEVLETRKRVLGDEHPETVNSLFNLVMYHRKRGEFVRAVELIRPTLDMHANKYGRDHWRTIWVIEKLAEWVLRAGVPGEAEPLFREAYESRLSTHGPTNSVSANARKQLAECLRALNRHDEADALESAGVPN